MLIAMLLGLPLWKLIPGYFLVGICWALAYLPRSITLQARSYKAWRDQLTGGKPVADILGANGRDQTHPKRFIQLRDDRLLGFSERRIIIGFMVNIAFWPLRMLEKLVFDGLQLVWETLGRWMRELFVVLGRCLRALGRWCRAVWEFFADFAQAAYRLLCRGLRVIRAVLRRLARAIWRLIGKWVRALWYDLLAPMVRWIYRVTQRIYQRIIQSANREALADMEMLKTTDGKD